MTDNSHYHCWDQKQPPACGLKGEHKRCCLCEATRHPTHNALVQEWKEMLLRTDMAKEYPETFSELADWFELAMLAAAKGAAEAGRLGEADTGNWDQVAGYNAAISQSERQLENYFKEV